MYYDIGNSTKAGFNVVREIDWLGKKRICQMHFKDNPHYLGEGTIDMADVFAPFSQSDSKASRISRPIPHRNPSKPT